LADIVYTYRGKVYLNITNRCPCRCTFCIRSNGDGLGSAHTLWHKSDPTAEEIAKAIEEFDFSDFPEVTFCGYGEPLCAFDNLVIAGRLLKSKYPDIKIRINTNGLGNLINKKDTVPAIAEFTDTVSISLNAPNAERYNEISRPKFGIDSFKENTSRRSSSR
jgi:TatD family-associated radical SAM protein